LACSYKNEGSIPFTRSNIFLSIFEVFLVTVLRVALPPPRSPKFPGCSTQN
jgi:hypothetical protein